MIRRVFLDCETSGLDKTRHQILTFALVVCEDEAVVFAEEFKVKQQIWAEMDSKALEINGIDLEEHNKEGVEEASLIRTIAAVLRKYGLYRPMPHGQNVTFDIGFLEEMYKRQGLPYPFSYQFQDTRPLGILLNDAGLISCRNAKLATLCEAYGIDADWHRAIDDTIATAKLYFAMMRQLKGVIAA